MNLRIPIAMAAALVCAVLPIQPLYALGQHLSPCDQRPFWMGFTPWPPDLTNQAVQQVYEFIGQHADLIAFHFDAGVPWQEAYDGRPFSQQLQNDWEFKKSQLPAGTEAFVAITPLNFTRDGLALYWGEQDGMPLPSPWDRYQLDDPAVMTAFLNYADRIVEHFNPRFLAIGIESNILLSTDPEKWTRYLLLNKFVYASLKEAHPRLTVFSSVQYEHLRGLADESKPHLELQSPGVRELLESSDLLALSTYHYGLDHNPIGDDYFAPALEMNKPIAISEMGAISQNVTVMGQPIKATEADQNAFLRFILDQAEASRFKFVVNFMAIDCEAMLPKLPEDAREMAKAWVYTGIVAADRREKPALSTWDSFHQTPKCPAEPQGLKLKSLSP